MHQKSRINAFIQGSVLSIFFMCSKLYAHQKAPSLQEQKVKLEASYAHTHHKLSHAQADSYIDSSDPKNLARITYLKTCLSFIKEQMSDINGRLALQSIQEKMHKAPAISAKPPPSKKESKKSTVIGRQSTKAPAHTLRKKSKTPPAQSLEKKGSLKAKTPAQKTLTPKQKAPPVKKALPPSAPPALYTHPIVKSCTLLKPYGTKGHHLPDPMHNKDGIVLSCPAHSTVFAPASGEIVLVEKVFGHTACIIKHSGDYYTALYGITNLFISEHDLIHEGQALGTLQTETPALLYAEMRQKGAVINISKHCV